MKLSAVLLIDLENFCASRRDYFSRNGVAVGEQSRRADDVRTLVAFAARVTKLPLAVRRAYANFMSFTDVTPRDVMEAGIEPVQTFCLSDATNKNAADMKMALDAAVLAAESDGFEHFVLVTGDGDFLPVVLELKRRGRAVSAVGVTGSSNMVLRRAVDHFRYFEGLKRDGEKRAAPTAAPAAGVAPAAEVAGVPPTREQLDQMRDVLRAALAARSPMTLGQVPGTLKRLLPWAFRAQAFGYKTVGGFLRRYRADLGLDLSGTGNDTAITPRGAVFAHASNGNGNGNGYHAPGAQGTAELTPAAPEPHTAAHYRHLLGTRREGSGDVTVAVIAWPAVVRMCDTAAAVLAPPYGRPTDSMSLLARLKEAGGPDEARLMVNALRAALGVPTRAHGADLYALPAGTTGAHVRARLLRYVTGVLGMRLTDAGVAGPVRADAVAELFRPEAAAAEQVAAEVAAALAGEPDPLPGPAAPAPAAPAPPPAPRAPHEWHTADGYRELLQTARVRVGNREVPGFAPPPLACIERVCADTLAALRPPTGSAPEVRRGQFLPALYKGAERLGLEGHQNHVKRAVDLLLLCYGLTEDGRVELHTAITDAEHLCQLALSELLKLVHRRLGEQGVPGPVRAYAFLAAIAAADRTDLEPTIAGWAAQLAEEAAPAAAPAHPPGDEVPLAAPDAPPAVDTTFAGEGTDEHTAESAAVAALPEPDASELDGRAFGADSRAPEPVGGPPSGVLDLAALTRAATAAAEPAGIFANLPPEPELALFVLEPEWLADEPDRPPGAAPAVLRLVEDLPADAVPAAEPLSLDDDHHYAVGIPVGDWALDEEPVGDARQLPLPADARVRLAKIPPPGTLQPPLPPESA